MKRTLSLVLVLAMVFSAMLGVISFAETDETPATYELSANLQFAETIYLLVAVKCPAGVDTSKVTVSIKNNVTGDVTTLTRDESVETGTGFPAGALGFKHIELGAKNMGDELTISVLNDGKAVEGATKIFSVLEYALKAENVGDADLTNLVRAMIKYGAKSQTSFNHKGTYDLANQYSLVSLKGGATANGQAKSIVLRGTSVTATKAGAAADSVWLDASAIEIGTGASLTFNADKNYHSMFCAPASIKTNSYVFDMDKYTGTEGLYATDLGSVDGDAGNEDGWYVDENGVPVLKENAKYRLANGLMGVLNPGSKYIAQKGYVKLTNTKVLDPIKNDGKSYAYQSGFRWESGAIYNSIPKIATDASSTGFTMSFTVAADANMQQMFSDICFRSGTGMPARVYFLLGSSGNNFNKFLIPNSTTTTKDGGTAFASAPITVGGVPSKYITIHMVVKFESNDSENATMTYYVNDNSTPLGTLDLGIKKANFAGGTYIDGMLVQNATMYVKSLVITNGDITENFK